MKDTIITLTPPINEVQYGYSDEPIKEGDWACRNTEPFVLHIQEGWNNSLDLQYRKIVCCNNPKDLRFPYLVLPNKEQEVEKLAEKYFNDNDYPYDMRIYSLFEAGFNANKGKYTQEQMITFAKFWHNAIITNFSSAKDIIRSDEDCFNKYIQSLQPTAKAVRVEMEVDLHSLKSSITSKSTISISAFSNIKVETSSEHSQGVIKTIEVIY